MNKQIIVHDLGLVDYQDALDYQLQLFNQIIDIKLKNRKNNTKIETDNHLICFKIKQKSINNKFGKQCKGRSNQNGQRSANEKR